MIAYTVVRTVRRAASQALPWLLLAALHVGWNTLMAQPARSGTPVANGLFELPLGALVDQFNQPVPGAAVRGGAVVVLVADKDGADGQRLWLTALRSAAPTGMAVIAVADLVGAPRLLRGVIRRGFPTDTTARIFMDWEGKVARRMRGERDHLVGVRFAADGSFRERVVLPVDRVNPELRARLLNGGEP